MQSPLDFFGLTLAGMHWLVHIVDFTLRSTIILASAWLITLLLRKVSAATRHMIWVIAFSLVLLVPLSLAVIPQISIPFIPSVQHYYPALELGYGGYLSVGSKTGAWLDEISAMAAVVWPAFAFIAWTGGMLIQFMRLVFGIGAVQWLSLGKSNIRFSHHKMDIFANLCSELDFQRPIQLLRREKVRIPMTSGFLRPIIILPLEAEEWSDTRFRSVLLHELAHVKRFDFLSRQVAVLASIICWFNPLVIIAARRMQEEMETACDDLVLRQGIKASDYALDLANIVRNFGINSGNLSRGGVAMAGSRNSLPDRLRRILNPNVDRNPLSGKAVAFLAVVLMLFALPAYMLQPFITIEPCPALIFSNGNQKNYDNRGDNQQTNNSIRTPRQISSPRLIHQ